MTEEKLRQQVVDTAKQWLGCNEGDGSHKKIIDLYNEYRPLARGYAVKYSDHWCATFVSAVAVKLGLTDVIPTECSCGKQIALFQKIGCWQERDNITPQTGDIIFYDWNDNGQGDNSGSSEHVGIVVSVEDGRITVIEGNKNEAVSYRSIEVDGRYIRGYGLPNYKSKADSPASWAVEAWEKAKELGVLDGKRPTDNLTRQEFAVVIHRLGLI